jgi:hypothetical protein
VIAPPLAFDFEALDRTAANDVPNENGANLLRRTDQVTPGAERLLRKLVKRGLADSALPTAAALVIELDQPRSANGQEGAREEIAA